ncbi:overexpressed in colon carcinoma 1 protein isoform X1 [Sminthopsis crassicaudata]|uniref:overexpressed in colon carcinoma 1 protein isoform X1 n=1 Tax=Sminthopsis crassicaudata TaxID=9301 RepID=UPI003D693EC4
MGCGNSTATRASSVRGQKNPSQMMTREGTTEGSMLAYPRILLQWLPIRQRVQERKTLHPDAINKSLLINIWEELSHTGDDDIL